MLFPDDKKNYRIFLASTWEDLKKEREEIPEALRHFYFQHVNMEYFGADPRKPIKKCLEEVQTSDVFVGIIGHRYGNILEDTGKSYTQMEYEEAVRIGLPCLIYMRSDDVPILPKYVENNQDSINKLEKFKSLLLKSHTVYYFNYSNDLVTRVTSDLSSLVQKVKTDKIPYTNIDALNNKIITVIDSYLNATQEKDKLLDFIRRHYGFYSEDDHNRIIGELKKASVSVMKSMAASVEARDPYSSGHHERVAQLAKAIAKECNLSQKQIEGIEMAGFVHDIGKIKVPAEILLNPTSLTDMEFSIIKLHPQSGYDILKDTEFPWPIARMILEHHEKMDGSGYPQGLTGNDILIESRILVVANVVENMCTHRPYRPALGIDMTLEEIEEGRGTFYDNDVVDACLRLFRGKHFEW
ncbi:MAG TPA: DUF4062 domain-containing protein [Syntrophales bacterium]|mgnify:CR=1 FL=1|nr:DUF4062 domain-containing protein [Syntrophales bacterium]